MIKFYLTILLLSSCGLKAAAQIDTLFWFAAPEIAASSGDSPVFLRFLTYSSPSTVTITQPANGSFVPITLTIPANSLDSINLTPFLAGIESPAANVISNNGLKISATSPISAFYELSAPSSKEQISLKGTKAKGQEFYTPFQKFLNTGTTTPASFSSIDIVATENNTTVLITPRTAITGHAANVTFSVVLNEGQTYSARDINVTAASSLSGSIVSSNKPVSVTLFDGALSSSGCLSPIADQITPVGFTGTDYIIRKNGNTDRVYVLAIQNNSSLTISSSAATTTNLINSGETFEVILTDSVQYIKSSRPVYIWHVSNTGCRLSGTQLPPVLCAGQYETAFTRSNSDSLAIILYSRTGFESQFTLNGSSSLIPANAFANVPGTAGAYKAAKIYLSLSDVPLNSYNKIKNTGDIFGFGVIGGSSVSGTHYTYFSNFTATSFVNAGADDTSCANIPFPLNGFAGGGSITGNWTTNGFGTFQSASSNLVNNYLPSPLDTLVSPIQLILTSTGSCPVASDTLLLEVSPAPIVNASANQSVCANNAVVQLNGSISGGSSTGNWITLGSGTFSPSPSTLNAQYTPSPADKNAGQVNLVLKSTNSGSCIDVTDTLTLFITAAPVVNAGADTITVCFNNPQVQLNGSVSGSSTTGKWVTTGNGFYSPNNLSLNAIYNPSSNDLNNDFVKLYLESTNNGNCLAVKDSLIVEFTDPPTANADENYITCTNDPVVQLSGTIGGAATQGIWSGGAGTYSPDNTTLNAVYTPTQNEINNGQVILSLTTTDNGNCNAVNDNVQISFVAPPFANFNFADACLQQPIEFEDFSLPGFAALAGWEWSFDDGQTAAVQNPVHLYSSAGSYDVQLITTSSVGCSDTVVKTVNIYELPNADYSYVTSCDQNQIIIQFTDQSAASPAVNQWIYDFGGQGGSADQNPSQLFVGFGNFDISLIVETQNGCRDTVVKQIFIPPYPEAGFSYNTSNGLNIGAVFNFIDTSNYANTYSWTFGDGNTSTAENPSNTYFQNGTYIVTQVVTGALGCVDSASTTITINTVTNEITTLIPNAISPNGDGRNDVWKLDFINLLYPDADVSVFNQWGQEIYSTKGYDIPWDAYYKGILVPEGTYFYVINLNAGTDQDIYKGSILVLLKD